MISILLPVRRAEATIAGTIEALSKQCAGHDAEVILAVSEGDNSLEGLAVTEPFRVVTVQGRAGVPQLRRAAALVARGEYLVITEDHCLFPAEWLASFTEAAARNPAAVCGGLVDNGRQTFVGWAQYFTRYSSFLPTDSERVRSNFPGNNACYPSALIRRHMDLITDGFWEAEFNAELAQGGVSFDLLPVVTIIQNQRRGAVEYVALRFRHGRCYGARRFAASGGLAKVPMLLLSPLLPTVLYWRMLRAVIQARWKRLIFLGTTPLVLLYVAAWSVGEVVGYLSGPGNSCTETD